MFIRRKQYLNDIQSLQSQIDRLSREAEKLNGYVYNSSWESYGLMEYKIPIPELLSLLLKHLKLQVEVAPRPSMPEHEHQLVKIKSDKP